MATEIYLGYPPQHVIDWIRNHSQPTRAATRIWWSSNPDDYDDYLIEGTFGFNDNFQTAYKVEFGNAVTSIDNAFYMCSTLTEVIIPSSVIRIMGGAFSLCENITNVTIGSNVTTIDDNTFDSNTKLTNIVIPNSVTNIGNNAFFNTGLINITIPDSVVSIGSYVFNNCADLTSVTFEGKDRATVQNMSNYPFGLNYAGQPTIIIHCTDGDIEVNNEIE